MRRNRGARRHARRTPGRVLHRSAGHAGRAVGTAVPHGAPAPVVAETRRPAFCRAGPDAWHREDRSARRAPARQRRRRGGGVMDEVALILFAVALALLFFVAVPIAVIIL